MPTTVELEYDVAKRPGTKREPTKTINQAAFDASPRGDILISQTYPVRTQKVLRPAPELQSTTLP